MPIASWAASAQALRSSQAYKIARTTFSQTWSATLVIAGVVCSEVRQ